MEFKLSKKIIYFTAVCFLLALSFAIGYVNLMGIQAPTKEAAVLGNWNYVDAGGSEKDILLPHKMQGSQNSQQVMYTVLPDAFSEAKTLAFWTEYQEVDVVLDNERIYSTRALPKLGKAIVPQWNMVDVPTGSAGKDLYLSFHTELEEYDYWVNDILYGTYEELDRTITAGYSFHRILDLIIMFVGVLYVVFGMITKAEPNYKLRQIAFGITVFCAGVWMQTNMDGFEGAWSGAYGNAFLSYFSLFLLPVVWMIYVKIRVMGMSVLQKVNDILICLLSMALPLTLFTQVMNIMDAAECQFIGWVNLSVAAAWGFFVFIIRYIQKREFSEILSIVNSGLFATTVLLIYTSEVYVSSVDYHVGELARICVLAALLSETAQLLGFLKKENEHKKNVLQQNKNLKIQALTNQIRPHFIMNTLGAIGSLIRINPEYAEEQLYEFSKYVRKNIEERDYSKVVPFFEEMDYINTYINLEKLRFGDRITVVRDLRYTDFMILPLTIQPLVENAIKHGLMEKVEGGTVWIRTFKLQNQICIEVEDDGVGFNAANMWENIDSIKSVGMRSALYRLVHEMDGQCYVSSIESGRVGTKLTIQIPMKWGTKDEDNPC